MVNIEIYPILFFVVVAWGFGYSLKRGVWLLADLFKKKPEQNQCGAEPNKIEDNKGEEGFLEKNILLMGFGLGVIPILTVIIALAKIQLVWWGFLILSLVVPMVDLTKYIRYIVKANSTAKDTEEIKSFKNRFRENIAGIFKIRKSTIYFIIVIFFFLASLYVMNKGAFTNPWLEDGDSWGHMGQIKYIELYKTFYNPQDPSAIGDIKDVYTSHYAIPYPQGYDVLMALLAQISDSPYWALKFFNAVFISMCIIFFYIFAKEFSGDRNIALFAAFIITIIPSFLSHFIWATTLAILLYFPAFYCVIKSGSDKENMWKWVVVAIVIIASILVTTPVTAYYFGAFIALYWLGKVITTRNMNGNVIAAAVGGGMVSCIFWVQMFILFGFNEVLIHLNVTKVKGGTDVSLAKLFHIHGTGAAGAKYQLMDFIWVKTYNAIHTPVGIGLVLSGLVLIGMAYFAYKIYKHIYKRIKEKQEDNQISSVNPQPSFVSENSWILISIIWFFFGIFSVLGEYFPFQMPFPFRAWSYLAISVALLGALGYFKLVEQGKKVQIPAIVIFVLVIIGLLLTSGYQKYTVNTAIWPNENFNSMDEVQPYLWMQDNLAKNTKVLSYCGDWLDVTGYDKLQEGWIIPIRDFRKSVINMTVSDVSSFMKQFDYSYIIVDIQCAKKYNITFANERLTEIGSSGLFTPVQGFQTGHIFKVN